MVSTKEINLLIKIEMEKGKLAAASKEIRKFGQNVGNYYTDNFKKSTKQLDAYNSQLTNIRNSLKKPEFKATPFAGWAMSIMFAGMALQRLATQLKQFGVKAYDDIRHSVEGSVTANDKLNASMTMLGFSVGEALQPLLESLIPIVDSIQEWVEKNPELVKSATELMFVLGTAAAAGGAIVLAKNGFGDMLSLMKGIPTSFDEIKNKDWSGLGSAIQTGIGAIVIGIGVADTISGMKELFDGDGEGGLRAGLKTMAGVLETVGGLKFIKGDKGGMWMMFVGIALDSVSKGTFITDFMNLFGWVSAMIATLVQSVIHGIKQMWKSATDPNHEYVNFDANKQYKENLRRVQAMGKEWQAEMNNFMYGDEIPAEFRSYSLPSEGAGKASQLQSQAIVMNLYGDIYAKDLSDVSRQAKLKFGIKAN